ncbi:MAG: FAD-dependent oxidoreductase [Actinobacteria bacterium]|nr:FAD-dependent oxidoreductase [Actinomycetota bacterium]
MAATTAVVVGSSISGVRTAQALRTEGFAGRLVLVGEESELPYDKPPLSKRFLSAGNGGTDNRLLSPEKAGELGIELLLGVSATGLDIATKTLQLADGSTVDWDIVVLATSASARPSPWPARSGVHVLRTLADARALRSDLSRHHPLVIVGGGFIGAEVAAAAQSLGCEVTLVDPLPTPIGRIVGEELGAVFNELHHRHGVATEFGVGVDSISGRTGALSVTLTDGRVLRAGTVVVGIGAVPNDGWLSASALEVADGVLCDEYCRAVNTTNVYVVGDLARHFCRSTGHYIRAEHWTNAVDSAATAAHNIAHPDRLRSHTAVDYIWSDQYDWKIQIVGRPALAAAHELTGTFAGESARGAALYYDEAGRFRGAVTVNWPRALMLCRQVLAAEGSLADARDRLGQLAAGRR